MKILLSNNSKGSQFHIMGLTSEEFYAIRRALGRDARIAADPDVKHDGWLEHEIENARVPGITSGRQRTIPSTCPSRIKRKDITAALSKGSFTIK